jgi:hypothetical protein
MRKPAQRSDWMSVNVIGKSQLSRSTSCKEQGVNSRFGGVKLGEFAVLSFCFFLRCAVIEAEMNDYRMIGQAGWDRID